MEVYYVLTIKKGCCNVCAKTDVLGVFPKIAAVNSFIRNHTPYGKVAQFVQNFDDIEIADDNHGLVTLSVTKSTLYGGS